MMFCESTPIFCVVVFFLVSGSHNGVRSLRLLFMSPPALPRQTKTTYSVVLLLMDSNACRRCFSVEKYHTWRASEEEARNHRMRSSISHSDVNARDEMFALPLMRT